MDRDDPTVENFASTRPADDAPRERGPTLEAGDRVGRYVVRKLLGEGGMGAVYLAFDPDLERLIALKLLHGDPAARETRAVLLQEAKATARLSHPNVVGVYDVGTFGDDLFIALEYVHGWTLRQWLHMQPRSWQQVVQTLIHAGRGLQAAHEAGLIHRDFKPENLLLGQDGRVRVADFGLARPLAHAEAPLRLDAAEPIDTDGATVATRLVGTPGYMAPEQLLGHSLDARTDVFAFAVTAWEALAGERPFAAPDVQTLFAEIFAGRARPFPGDSDVPPAIVAALRRALAVDPDERQASIAELLAVLAGASPERSTDSLSTISADTALGLEDMPRSLGVRYRPLEPVAGGSLGPIFRARDRLDGTLVALKRVPALSAPRSAEAAAARRLALGRELRTRMALRHPNIVGITDFGYDDEDVPFFVLDLPEGARSVTAARGEPLAIQVHLVAQLLRALAYLHRRDRRGVTLDARTVIVAGEVLRLIDTDLTTLTRKHRRLSAAAAPEIAEGGPPSVAGDLYAVGALVLALVAPRPDGDDGPSPELVSAVHDGDLRRRLDADPRIVPWLERMLAQDPARRPASAKEALDLLAAAAGVALPHETAHTRESFLQALPLVGRDREIAGLTHAVREAVRGRGGTTLLAGESGVGKSRLVDEVRTLAILDGLVVLRGTAVSDGGRLFEAFRPLLRWLAISAPLDDLEAGVLRLGVPDIDRLIGREVASAPDLDAESAQLRLLRTLVGLLKRQVRPLLVVLDDLHWARDETLALLAGLTAAAAELPLLLVGTYREDETPGLGQRIPGAAVMPLGRLDRPALAELATAMIGEPGKQPALLDFLARETEGNTLFVVEIMRALAEEAGELARVASRPLPAAIAAGGVQRVVLRTIRRLSPPAAELMRLAAVAGRGLDPALLAQLEPGAALTALLDECQRAAVIERDGKLLRFRHDKIREALLADLEPAAREDLHRRVAAAIVALHGDSREYAEAVAHHYRTVGDEARELPHLARAGEHALEIAPQLADHRLTRAIELGQRHAAPLAQLARWHRLAAEARYVLGDFPGSIAGARAALRCRGVRLPSGTLGWLVLLCGQIVVQALHLLRPPRGRADAREHDLEAARAAGRCSQAFLYTFERLPLLCVSLLAVNLAQRGGGTEPRSIALLAYTCGLVGGDRLARRYFDEGQRRASADDVAAALVDLSLMRSVYSTSRGDFPSAVAVADDALARGHRNGYALGVAQAEGILACVDHYRGDLQTMADRYARAVDCLRGGTSGHVRGIAWGYAWSLAELGRDAEAEALTDTLLIGLPAGERLHHSMIHGLRALLMARRGALADAVAAADAAMLRTEAADAPGNTPVLLTGPAEAYLAAWAAAAGPDAEPLARRARKQASVLRLWARLNPVGRAPAEFVQGHAQRLAGDLAGAVRRFRDGIAAAESQGLLVWAGRLHLALATHGPGDSRSGHRAAAERQLLACGAGHYLGGVESAARLPAAAEPGARAGQ